MSYTPFTMVDYCIMDSCCPCMAGLCNSEACACCCGCCCGLATILGCGPESDSPCCQPAPVQEDAGDGWQVQLWGGADGAGFAYVTAADLGQGRLVGAESSRLKLFDAKGELECVVEEFLKSVEHRASNHDGEVTSVASLGDGQLVTACTDGKVRIFGADPKTPPEDYAPRLCFRQCERVLEGHQGEVTAVASLGDGKLASGGLDGSVRIWSAADGLSERVEQHGAAVTALASLGDGKVASGGRDGTVKVWADGGSSKTLVGHTAAITSLAALSDGRVASGSMDKSIRIWGADGEVERIIPPAGLCGGAMGGHTHGVTAVAALGDGKLVSGSVDRTVRIWSVTAGQCERVMRAHNGAVSSVVVLDDRRVLSTSEVSAEMFMWSPSEIQAPGQASALT